MYAVLYKRQTTTAAGYTYEIGPFNGYVAAPTAKEARAALIEAGLKPVRVRRVDEEGQAAIIRYERNRSL